MAKRRVSKENQFRMPNLISEVQEITGLSRRESKVAIQAVIYAIKKGILDKGFVKIPSFGKFVKLHKKACTRKSFGKETNIPEKDVVKFKPLKNLKLLVNKKLELEQYVNDDEDEKEEKEEKPAKKEKKSKKEKKD